MSWWDAFTVVDVETSGLESEQHRVLELGFARFEGGVLVEKCNYVVWAPVSIDAETQRVNGLTQAAIDAARDWPFDRVWGATAPIFDGAHPAAFNAPFDRRFVQAEIRRHQGVWHENALRAAHIHEPGTAWIDPLAFVRHFDKYEGSKKLGDACRRRGIEIVNAHQAVWDCVATGQLFCTLASQLPADTGELLELQQKLVVADAHSYAAYKAKQDGQTLGPGCVFICDVCHERAFCETEKNDRPRGWSFYGPSSPGMSTVCSESCEAQMKWWDGTR